MLTAALSFSIYLPLRLSDFLDAPGVDVWGEYAHINLSKKCYVLTGVDSDSDSLESVITISGLLRPQMKREGAFGFTGHADLAGYPIPFADAASWTVGFLDEDFIWIHNQAMTLMVENCSRYYSIHILRSNPDIVVVEIYQEDGTILAVTGDNKEDAIKNYNTYMDLLAD